MILPGLVFLVLSFLSSVRLRHRSRAPLDITAGLAALLLAALTL